MPYGMIVLLFLTYAFSYLDRQVVNIVAEHIKRDLGLADWQIGAMSGLAFAILYTTCGLAVARIAERGNRVRIIVVSLIIWSGCTALFGLGRSFAELFLARLGVGFGEAGGTPPATALIADAVPATHQARALAIYNLGVPVGALLGMVLGGFIVQSFGWRATFLIIGPPGIILAAIIGIAIRDPRSAMPRRAEASDGADVPSMGVVLRSLTGSPAFCWLAAGAALTTFVGYGQQAFFASFFLRNHAAGLDMLATQFGFAGSTAFLGLALGLGLGIGGALGSFCGGELADRWRHPHAQVLIPAIGSLLAVPLYLLVLLLPSTGAALLLLALPVFMKSLWYGPVYATVQRIAHPRSRATAMAIFLLILNAVGLGLGPLTIGLISDWLAPTWGAGPALRGSLIAVSSVSVVSAACFLMITRVGRGPASLSGSSPE